MNIKLLKGAQATRANRQTNGYVKRALGIFLIATLLVLSTISTNVMARHSGGIDPEEPLVSEVVNWYCSSIGFGCDSED